MISSDLLICPHLPPISSDLQVLRPFAELLTAALSGEKQGEDAADGREISSVLADLYTLGGPLQRLAAAAPSRAAAPATARHGLLGAALEMISDEVLRIFIPPPPAAPAQRPRRSESVRVGAGVLPVRVVTSGRLAHASPPVTNSAMSCL